MDRYTFFMEFRGGLYISQVKEVNLRTAIVLWSESLDITEIKFMKEKGKLELQRVLQNEDPTPIDGVPNVWILHTIIKAGFVTIHAIKTADC
ncbi:hypothetical protein DVR12_10800 [Chitinophaga silvatica]|uniref:Uncharacterized protein n=1 Tax=Chitinophaga silvatica TaxID=2282649 RepID=A0A3E1YBP0_9BACT|nr:hypothetical protein [Chitinophaga silvatica]RFS23493.1 hypothetical protein DVR12_10800 [Chitinophaga silvatica]